MINEEEILQNILQPLIDNGTIGLYGFGNENELKETMDINKNKNIYPVCWLVMPFDGNPVQSLTKNQIDVRIKLILGTSSRIEWLNPKRNIETYGKVLNPLYDEIIKTFTKNLQIIIKDNEVNVKKLHNYHSQEQGTRSNPPKRRVYDYWDVILLEFDAIITTRRDCNVKTNPPKTPGIVLIIDGKVFTLGNNTVLTI
jgi:hypothetical protein